MLPESHRKVIEALKKASLKSTQGVYWRGDYSFHPYEEVIQAIEQQTEFGIKIAEYWLDTTWQWETYSLNGQCSSCSTITKRFLVCRNRRLCDNCAEELQND